MVFKQATCPGGLFVRNRPLKGTFCLQALIGQSTHINMRAFCEMCMFCINCCRGFVVESVKSHGFCKATKDIYIRQRLPWWLCDLVEVADPALGICHGSFLFKVPGCRKYKIREGKRIRFA